MSKAKSRPGPKSAKGKAKAGPAPRTKRTLAAPVNGAEEEDDPFEANDEEDPLDVTPMKER